MKSRKRQWSEEIEQLEVMWYEPLYNNNQEKIRLLGEKEKTYEYLGILEVDIMKQAEMKKD